MRKIIIIGSPGAGKSTLARKLRDYLDIPLYYLDMIWHKADKTNITKDEFLLKINKIVKQDKWIIDGNYLGTMELRLKECDTIIFLDYSLDVCLSGAYNRIGKVREDLPWIEDEFDEEFKKYIIDFPQEQLPRIYELINKYKMNKEVIILKNRQECSKYLESLYFKKEI